MNVAPENDTKDCSFIHLEERWSRAIALVGIGRGRTTLFFVFYFLKYFCWFCYIFLLCFYFPLPCKGCQAKPVLTGSGLAWSGLAKALKSNLSPLPCQRQLLRAPSSFAVVSASPFRLWRAGLLCPGTFLPSLHSFTAIQCAHFCALPPYSMFNQDFSQLRRHHCAFTLLQSFEVFLRRISGVAVV